MCVCVCVCFLPIHSGHQVRWTYQPGVTQEGGHTGFFIHLLSAVRALIFLARRIQPFLSLVDREVEFCVLTTLVHSDICVELLVKVGICGFESRQDEP